MAFRASQPPAAGRSTASARWNGQRSSEQEIRGPSQQVQTRRKDLQSQTSQPRDRRKQSEVDHQRSQPIIMTRGSQPIVMPRGMRRNTERDMRNPVSQTEFRRSSSGPLGASRTKNRPEVHVAQPRRRDDAIETYHRRHNENPAKELIFAPMPRRSARRETQVDEKVLAKSSRSAHVVKFQSAGSSKSTSARGSTTESIVSERWEESSVDDLPLGAEWFNFHLRS
mmetsp:Transcript_88151/g.139342  ORF Transcript_88151/g.139342 Transcript_88151/m.139342 type:complete len:225 (-) Transcript_88151:85-759(-)